MKVAAQKPALPNPPSAQRGISKTDQYVNSYHKSTLIGHIGLPPWTEYLIARLHQPYNIVSVSSRCQTEYYTISCLSVDGIQDQPKAENRRPVALILSPVQPR